MTSQQRAGSTLELSPAGRARPDVSVIVVNYNTAHLLHDMWSALAAAQAGLTLEVIVVDNASRDASVQMLQTDPAFAAAHLIVNPNNVGFGRANNQALAHASGRYVLLLNTDAFVAPDTLARTVARMDAEPRCGVLGVRLVGRDGAVQPSCRFFPTPWNLFLARSGLSRVFRRARMVDDPAWQDGLSQECDWVPGCYLLTRKALLDEIGLFDPRYFLYFEEVDFCRRVGQAGWKTLYFADTTVVHLGGESAKTEGVLTAAGQQISALQIESELLYFRKNHGLAGLLALVGLSWLADFLQAAKAMVKGRAGAMGTRGHAGAVAKLLRSTAWGSVPTR
ncbi:MAG: glycosyltransferase family 2 protein [Caldimonas sp.]